MKRLVLSLLLCSVVALAQHAHNATEAAKPAELLEGLGSHTHTIATESTLAQNFFDQGLALIYGFNHDEAARLFARAAELDSRSPMPYWGIALALGPNYNMPPQPDREEKAWKAIERAVVLAKKAPDHEQAYVNALTTRYSKDPNADRHQLAIQYREAMRQVHSRYPDDLDAATLYAESIMNLRPWQLWNPDGSPAEDTPEVLDILESVLRRNPNHPGANHYYIHAVEASRNPERALPSAYRLGNLMPGAGHMVHMPSHIFIRTGDHELSATVNVTASEVDRKYIERTGTAGIYRLMYYSHNLHFVSYARMMQGRYDEALDYSKRLRENVQGSIDEMPMLAPYGAFEWLVLTRFGKWNEMLAEPEPKENVPALHAYYRYARGLAMAGLGRAADLAAESERMAAICARIPEDQKFMINPVHSVLAVGQAELRAKIARRKGDAAGEIAALREAVAAEDKLSYMEPPEWHYPVREALGAALLRHGKASEAEAVFRRDLEINPRNGRSLYGLLQCLKAQGNSAGAESVQREYDAAWKEGAVELEVDTL
jgi:tetratricopeptide (TPR) repeat protein